MGGLVGPVCLVDLVCLVCFVCLVCSVEQDQFDEPEKPNRLDEPNDHLTPMIMHNKNQVEEGEGNGGPLRNGRRMVGCSRYGVDKYA